MREIVFDTETTGLEFKNDRVIEIGGIELFNHFPTGRSFHVYINPGDRRVHPDALAVHGITDDFLKDKPTFDQIIDELVEFFDGARWVAHNATFDMTFINAEFARIGREAVPGELVVDTLALARRKHPMGPNSLDALCRRYGIDNSHRTKHGALLDSELLAEVYIEMLGGRQATFGLMPVQEGRERGSEETEVIEVSYERPRPLPPRISAAEMQGHAGLVARLGQKAIWGKYGA
ncbi:MULTISPECIES: DNA polymerase III subunit epsilon [Alphaproteobacteria]|uniref:DNA polymerase III subunit epsilon n=2 Tax=Alphaproteobacteria TaxID=28211 RepID=A0A512HMH0_9HYPH|nr:MULTISPECIES: DNA polymerase III subunit epsilon [Alphaproteobacteria]GEO86590.1 DNA polymerase III subunit epsilon [Ciceribacter naphthalenivorans]GLR20838.1 DNA polymerase III subunit epsilon [Ciceribacter naphthalenivorans]GLT03694.1 DNA polymerase III subunit epsilon [Sphingomonas psychrolutea]